MFTSSLIIVMSLLAIMPMLVMGITSYVKISVVLSLLRNAIGAGQTPSTAVIGSLTLVLTLITMSPMLSVVGSRIQESGLIEKLDASSVPTSQAIEDIKQAARAVAKPISKFMSKHANVRERAYFANLLSSKTKGEALADVRCHGDKSCAKLGETPTSLAAAFLVSELAEAFRLGLKIFLPFVVVDLVVSMLLTGLGMTMLTPTTLTLPLKLLLFTFADGWYLVCKSLTLSYL